MPFPRRRSPRGIAFVDCGITIGKSHFRVALLLLDSIPSCIRSGKNGEMSGLKRISELTPGSVLISDFDHSGSFTPYTVLYARAGLGMYEWVSSIVGLSYSVRVCDLRFAMADGLIAIRIPHGHLPRTSLKV